MVTITLNDLRRRWFESLVIFAVLSQACSQSDSQAGTSSRELGGTSGNETQGGSSAFAAGGTGVQGGSSAVAAGGNSSLVSSATSVSTGSGGANANGGSAGTGSNSGGVGLGTGGGTMGGGNTAGSGGTKGNSGGSKASGGTGIGGTSGALGGTNGLSTSTAANGSCSALSLQQQVKIKNGNTDRFSWFDADCRPRSAAMQRVGGGYVRQFTYEYDGKIRTASGTGVNGYNGWGFPANHELANALALEAEGTFGALFVGAHHALYQYHLVWPGTTDVAVTLTWFFATGRSNPVLAITYDLSAARPDKYEADTRTPYGDIAWDGDENWQQTVVSGVGWGDRYKFITKTAPLTMNSEWDYTHTNLVPYVFVWAVANDAEMGAVQTQTYEQHDGGGYWLYANWGKTSANQTRDADQAGLMPVTWNWTYQVCQYELCGDDATCDVNTTTNSHRLAWGANYGAVGSPNYPAYGDDKTLSGYPYQSYSVFMVLGKHTDAPVYEQVAEIETVQKTTLTASVGSIPAQGAAGVGRTDEIPLAPVGYDHRFSIWIADAADGRLSFTVLVSSGTLKNPVLAIRNYKGATEPRITRDGRALVSGVDFFASVDSSNETAYVTFHGGWTGTQNYDVE